MEFICTNPECPRHGRPDYYAHVSVVIRDGEPYTLQAPCPSCHQIRQEVRKEAPDPRNIYVGKFRSLSKEQKQESLKKRAHEHYKKEIAPVRAGRIAAVREEVGLSNKK